LNATENINQLTAHLFRENSGKMNAVLTRMFGLGQLDFVVDIVQDTFESALSKWKFSGVPENPSAWLMTVAKNKALNTFNRESKSKSFSSSVYLTGFEATVENQFNILISDKEVKDSQLRLLFATCDPELSEKNQIVVTLNILCGFGVPEIASALLMNEEAVKKALTRGKETLKKLGGILQTNIIAQSAERVGTVQVILYLMFNEGYKTTRSNEAINTDLCFEAIRLAKLLENENGIASNDTHALLAMMFFNLSRFPARTNQAGDFLTLEEQDRKQWNKIFIEEGHHYLNRISKSGDIKLSRFYIEAVIASLHCHAKTFEETDWEKISFLYRQLELMEPDSPLITLNRIIAESYLPKSNGLKELEEIEGHSVFRDNFLVPATKGDIYRRKGEMMNAQLAYQQALKSAVSPIDKKFLERKIVECQSN
jgi:RNA polymerase sigma factor (sigma-70 family)